MWEEVVPRLRLVVIRMRSLDCFQVYKVSFWEISVGVLLQCPSLKIEKTVENKIHALLKFRRIKNEISPIQRKFPYL
jgi:hypothetical protein